MEKLEDIQAAVEAMKSELWGSFYSLCTTLNFLPKIPSLSNYEEWIFDFYVYRIGVLEGLSKSAISIAKEVRRIQDS